MLSFLFSVFHVGALFSCVYTSVAVKRRYGMEPDIIINKDISFFNCREYCYARNARDYDAGLGSRNRFVCACQCEPTNAVYLRSQDKCCTPNQDCRFFFVEARTDIPVFSLNGTGLRNAVVGNGIDYCNKWDSPKSCSSLANCNISAIHYENCGWKDLVKGGTNNFLVEGDKEIKWSGKKCLAGELSGLLVRITLHCQVKGVVRSSCLMFRTNGTLEYVPDKNSTAKPFACSKNKTPRPHFSLNITSTGRILDTSSSVPLTSAVPTTLTSITPSLKRTPGIHQRSHPYIRLQTRITTQLSAIPLEDPVYLPSGNNRIISQMASIVTGILAAMVVIFLVMIVRRKQRSHRAKLAVQADLEECRENEILKQRQRQEEVLTEKATVFKWQGDSSSDTGTLASSGYVSSQSSYVPCPGGALQCHQESDSPMLLTSFHGGSSPPPSENSTQSAYGSYSDQFCDRARRVSSLKDVMPSHKILSKTKSHGDRFDKAHLETLRAELTAMRERTFIRRGNTKLSGSREQIDSLRETGIDNEMFEL